MEKEKKKYPIGADHYLLFEEIGNGVSASVHRALCNTLNEIVAIKILDFERANCDMVAIKILDFERANCDMVVNWFVIEWLCASKKLLANMSVVGFDFGNENCVVAVARQRCIDVVLNDESKHLRRRLRALSEMGRATTTHLAHDWSHLIDLDYIFRTSFILL